MAVCKQNKPIADQHLHLETVCCMFTLKSHRTFALALSPASLLLLFQTVTQVPEESSRPLNSRQAGKLSASVPLYFVFVFKSCLIISSLIVSFLSLPVVPRPGRHRRPMTAPKSQRSTRKKVLLTVLSVLVLLGILATAAFFSTYQYLKVFPFSL